MARTGCKRRWALGIVLTACSAAAPAQQHANGSVVLHAARLIDIETGRVSMPGEQHVLSNATYANSVEELISAMRAQHKEGSDFVKIYVDMHALEHVAFVMKGGVIETRPPLTR
jgi:hypothetical protein